MNCGQQFPDGVILRDLVVHADARGELFELFRMEWNGIPALRQWNVVNCVANSLRGVHLHPVHTDYLFAASGRFTFGLQDLRPHSPTFNQAAVFELSGELRQSLTIPPGVAHGFLCREAGSQIYGMTCAWDPMDDMGCRWDDPELGFLFEAEAPILSDRDANAGTFAALMKTYRALLADRE
jgi:dTDP-4-dehydrorhamnose 3,5-epimerase